MKKLSITWVPPDELFERVNLYVHPDDACMWRTVNEDQYEEYRWRYELQESSMYVYGISSEYVHVFSSRKVHI